MCESECTYAPLAISLTDAIEVEVPSTIGSTVSVGEHGGELLKTYTSSLGVGVTFSAQIASFAAAINLVSLSVNSSGDPQMSNCSMLIFQMVLLTKLLLLLYIYYRVYPTCSPYSVSGEQDLSNSSQATSPILSLAHVGQYAYGRKKVKRKPSSSSDLMFSA